MQQIWHRLNHQTIFQSPNHLVRWIFWRHWIQILMCNWIQHLMVRLQEPYKMPFPRWCRLLWFEMIHCNQLGFFGVIVIYLYVLIFSMKYQMQLISFLYNEILLVFLMENIDHYVLGSKYHGCWWVGHARNKYRWNERVIAETVSANYCTPANLIFVFEKLSFLINVLIIWKYKNDHTENRVMNDKAVEVIDRSWSNGIFC